MTWIMAAQPRRLDDISKAERMNSWERWGTEGRGQRTDRSTAIEMVRGSF